MKKIFTILIASSLLFACNKEENSGNILPSAGNENIVVFESYDEYLDELQNSLKRTPEERKVWEQSQGIVSFGRLCDELYLSTDFEQFGTLDEIKDFVDSNSDYLQLTKDENGEFIVDAKNPSVSDRYVLNKNCMFQINENVYKVYENGTAVTSVANIAELKTIDEYAAKSLPITCAIKYLPEFAERNVLKSDGKCSYKFTKKRTNGKNRLEYNMYIKFRHNDNPKSTEVWTSYYIRPFKRTLWTWVWAKRTITGKAKVTYSCKSQKGGFEIKDLDDWDISSHSYGGWSTSDFHTICKKYHATWLSYNKIDSWVSTSKVRVSFLCNGNPYFN